jgi:DNA replication ATP-dependent helicase Dna2
MRELFIKVKDVRVFVSTVSSVLSNPEIMNLKDYNIAIVDEATQILEPHLVGILSKIEKFILIGDEKQLPAVVIQEESKTKVESELLKGIQLDNLSNSLFERLLKRCLYKNWNAYNILTYQARMHEDIQDFPNRYFYNNNLKTMPSNDWQLSETGVIKSNDENEIIKLLSSSRVVFINTEREFKSKVNIAEAKQVKLIVNELIANLAESFNENSIGIISPFRAQCAEIYRQLGIELKQKILCDTVERFQGSEKDIIIISLAVNYEVQLQTIQSIAQFGDTIVDRKLNVAMTRAKHNLIILGNESILNKSQIYSDLIDYIKGIGGFFEMGEN